MYPQLGVSTDIYSVYALSLGIYPDATTSGFYINIASGTYQTWTNQLTVSWFAWNGTGTNCLSNADQVVCNGHGFCPDDSDVAPNPDDGNYTACECDDNWLGTPGCTECADMFAGSSCVQCDGYYSNATTGVR